MHNIEDHIDRQRPHGIKTFFLHWSLHHGLGFNERTDWSQSRVSSDHGFLLRSLCRSRQTLLESWLVAYSSGFLKYEHFFLKYRLNLAQLFVAGCVLSGVDVPVVEMVHQEGRLTIPVFIHFPSLACLRS